MGDLGSIPRLGISPGAEHGNSLQYSCLENPHGQRSLVGCSPRGHKELDTTERLNTAQNVSGNPFSSAAVTSMFPDTDKCSLVDKITLGLRVTGIVRRNKTLEVDRIMLEI